MSHLGEKYPYPPYIRAAIEDAAWDVLDPPQRRQRILEAVKRLLLRGNQVQPLLLVFVDLQWMDSESQALLDALIEGLPTTRILLSSATAPGTSGPGGQDLLHPAQGRPAPSRQRGRAAR